VSFHGCRPKNCAIFLCVWWFAVGSAVRTLQGTDDRKTAPALFERSGGCERRAYRGDAGGVFAPLRAKHSTGATDATRKRTPPIRLTALSVPSSCILHVHGDLSAQFSGSEQLVTMRRRAREKFFSEREP
jgi:hypothetical protein